MLDNLFKFKTLLEEEGIIFNFVGAISQDVVEGIGSVLREKMSKDNIKTSTSLKVFSIFIEQIQNVMNYSQDRIPENDFHSNISFGMILVGCKNDEYFIVGGNRVNLKQKIKIEDALKIISTMNPEELKKYYKEKRRSNPDAESKGAGLGLIEMAKRSSKPIEYNFETIDDDNFYFTIKTII